ncbi:MAG: DUF2934 domain-containing protein [Edaphobacter sp.]
MNPLFRPTMEEFEKLSFKVTDMMREHAFPYIAAISTEIEPNEGEHRGTGLYVELGNDTYLLTNEHVARKIKERPLAHQLIEGEGASRITNPVQAAFYPYDLAVTRIDRGIWSQENNRRRAFQVARLAIKHDPVDKDFLFLQGYSGERSYFSPTHQILINKATSFLTQSTKEPFVNLPAMLFALHYPPDLAKSLTPNSGGLPIPFGLSGSPVWDTNFHRCVLDGRRWTPEESRITGVALRWSDATAHLLVLRIEYVREFLLYALRNEAAYFHWVERGRPNEEALVDWDWAERNIPSL